LKHAKQAELTESHAADLEVRFVLMGQQATVKLRVYCSIMW